MFSKTAAPNGEPGQAGSQVTTPPAGASRSNATRSVLGSDLKITGEISSTGALEVLGEVDGNITADALAVGQHGRISGSVSAKSVEVHGRLDGKVDSQHFIMRATAQVTADITYDTLVIESGATIEGRFTRGRG
ncbi:polymer-forming cytoskeletal protein [Rhodobacter sp. 24-YEA-8]|uniref:bactofilin family protein n=1 Tax=Rhodobacter sp. 24-YEA-8 TaxID=1884310 RepID=UPI00089C2C50|nr:polymer-forming cytoskeletal protein [Rhodobacter sp. 24-YEA-8]SEC03776.1 protein CcmA, bactofilin family [Rhodobacter sp. 24-YEA-8]